MPRITLSNSQSAIISVKKSNLTLKRKNKEFTRRQIRARIMILKSLQPGQKKADVDAEFIAETVCSENDQFDPKYGRQEAVRRLLKNIGDTIKKQDRELIIKTLCPELFLTKTERMRREYEKLKKIFEPVEANPIEKVA